MADDAQFQFLKLHMAHQRALLGYLLAAVGDYATAEDLLQETTLVLWEKFGEYRKETPYAAWAFGIARNKLAQHFRNLRRRDGALRLSVLDRVAGALVEGEKRFSAESQALADCVKKLPSELHALVAFRYEKGYSLQGLAERLGQTASAVNMKLVRIRRALLDCTERVLRKETGNAHEG